ncbi:MAG TPA: chromate transporter [Defluviitaleaceae bacterium]|nr:chromate transporter [Defluviitaleaceae bacterium]HPT75195.1 chromate transporter [Defluviitaleaceae bacterium]
MIYLLIYYEFFKIGLFAIGGGLATIPFIQDLAQRYNWISIEELIDMIAISESTPGPIGINIATYTGYKISGVFGSLAATLGIITPSIIIILLIAHFYMKFSEEPIVRAGLTGIRPAVIGLIAVAAFEVIKIALFNIEKFYETKVLLDIFNFKAIVLFSLLLFFIQKYKKHPILYIAASAVIGILIKY